MVSWSQLHDMKEAAISAVVSRLTSLMSVFVAPETATGVLESIRIRDLINSGIYATAFVLGSFVLVYTLERLASTRQSRYRSRVFRQDVVYTFLYKMSAFEILIWAALATALEPRLSFLKLELTASLPPLVTFAIFYVAIDFFNYWWHRWMHASPFLWAFHSVHHTQEEMSFATAQRTHPVEALGYKMVLYVLLLVLGIPTFSWLPFAIALNIFLAVQHSALDWGYGKAYFLFVSPRFHALHHSADRREYMGNYSAMFSIWDFMFGTGIQTERPPKRVGVDGLPVPRTLLAQLLAPIRILVQARRSALVPHNNGSEAGSPPALPSGTPVSSSWSPRNRLTIRK